MEEKLDKNQIRAKYTEEFITQMRKESDRGSVIVAVSLLDDILGQLLKAKLAPSQNKSDELFDGSTAPFSTFASKIDLAYRMGLLRSNVKSSFHLLRKIRNNFAHATNPKGFDSESTKSRITELFKLNEPIISSMTRLYAQSSEAVDHNNFNIREALDDRLILEIIFGTGAAFLLCAIDDVESIEPLI